MKVKNVILIFAFALTAVACGHKGSSSVVDENGSTNSTEEIACEDLAGKTFNGVDGNVNVPNPPPESCEGCGQPGFINFESATEASLVLPDDDQGQSCTYSIDRSRVHLRCILNDVNLRIVDNCSRLEGEGMVFVEH